MKCFRRDVSAGTLVVLSAAGGVAAATVGRGVGIDVGMGTACASGGGVSGDRAGGVGVIAGDGGAVRRVSAACLMPAATSSGDDGRGGFSGGTSVTAAGAPAGGAGVLGGGIVGAGVAMKSSG